MAEKKESKPEVSYGAFEIVFIIILIVGAIGFVSDWLSKNHNSFTILLNSSLINLINFYAKYVVFSFFLVIILIILLTIYIIREREIRKKIMDKVLPKTGVVYEKEVDVEVANPKWKLIEEHIESNDASKWKLAILEADIILSEELDNLGLIGDGVGEKLKNIDSAKLSHIEEVWEAHKIRNAIAHQGSDFILTQREAKRVIRLYESVFKELKII